MNNVINALKTNTEIVTLTPIKEAIQKETSHILEAFFEMSQYRSWSESTLQSYENDVNKFQEYLMKNNLDPLLKFGEELHLVNGWIKEQKSMNVAYKTISRRIATLSSMYSFYKELGIVTANPFKASEVPGSHVGSHSCVMDLDEMKQVYEAIQDLKNDGIDLEIPTKLLMFTGLRNQAYPTLKVKNINWEESVLVYDDGIDNSKHKVQVLPLTPKLLATLKEFIETNHLEPNDPLCYGLKKMPLANKQLNRITDMICKHLGWTGENKVTPHGFRYSISTLLDERSVSRENIKYLLGHCDKENVERYIKSNKRKIFQLRTALIQIEEELENYLTLQREEKKEETIEMTSEHNEFQLHSNIDNTGISNNFVISEEFLLKLASANPALAEKFMIQQGLLKNTAL